VKGWNYWNLINCGLEEGSSIIKSYIQTTKLSKTKLSTSFLDIKNGRYNKAQTSIKCIL